MDLNRPGNMKVIDLWSLEIKHHYRFHRKARDPMVALAAGQFGLSLMQTLFMFYYVKVRHLFSFAYCRSIFDASTHPYKSRRNVSRQHFCAMTFVLHKFHISCRWTTYQCFSFGHWQKHSLVIKIVLLIYYPPPTRFQYPPYRILLHRCTSTSSRSPRRTSPLLRRSSSCGMRSMTHCSGIYRWAESVC